MEPIYINTLFFTTLSIASFIWAKRVDNKNKKRWDPFLYGIWGWMDIFWQMCLSVISGAFAVMCIIAIIYNYLK